MCPFCGTCFQNEDAFGYHLKMEHRNKSKCFFCDRCGVDLADTNDLELHLHQVHNLQYNHKMTCGFCGRTFKRPQEKLRHMREVHCGVRPHVCPHCGSDFKRKEYLMKHMYSQHKDL